jgi:hypothetical protein
MLLADLLVFDVMIPHQGRSFMFLSSHDVFFHNPSICSVYLAAAGFSFRASIKKVARRMFLQPQGQILHAVHQTAAPRLLQCAL